jgi:excisionase family DNA binding protein
MIPTPWPDSSGCIDLIPDQRQAPSRSPHKEPTNETAEQFTGGFFMPTPDHLTSEMNNPTPSNTVTPMPSPYLSTKEAASYLRISPRHLANLTASCRIKVARIGRRLIYKREELDRYVNLLLIAA